MRKWQSVALVVITVTMFGCLFVSPIGGARAYSLAYGKATGKICGKAFCLSPATRTLTYSSGRGKAKEYHYCVEHARSAPSWRLSPGPLASMLVWSSLISVGIGLFCGGAGAFSVLLLLLEKDPLTWWENYRLLLAFLLGANIAPWMAALLCCH
jgi:hypothetical protein